MDYTKTPFKKILKSFGNSSVKTLLIVMQFALIESATNENQPRLLRLLWLPDGHKIAQIKFYPATPSAALIYLVPQ